MQQEVTKVRCAWLLGDNNPAKRLEVREKIRIAKLGNTCGRGNKGKRRGPLPEAVRHKLSLAHKGKRLSLETRAKLSQALAGRKLSEEHKKNLSLGQHRRFLSPMEREKARQNNLIHWNSLTEEGRAIIVKPLLENTVDWVNKPGGDARRRAISIGNTRAWGLMTPDVRHQIGCKAVATSIRRGNKHLPKARPNISEKKLQRLLVTLFSSEYKYTGSGEVWIGNRNPDFTNVNGKKAVIELWGDYWHAGKDPEELIQYYRKYGFSCLVIWERELVDEQAASLVNKLLRFNKDKELI